MSVPDGASAEDSARDHPVRDIVNRLERSAQGDRVSVGDAVEAFGRRSFLPLLMVPALLVVSPLSGIPLFSSLCGITIVLVSAQMLWPGQDTLWMPRALLKQNIKGARAREALAKLCGTAEWLDAHARERFCRLVLPPGNRLVEAACLLCGAAMPFLEVVPFSSSILGGAVLLMGLGLLARDGLIAAAGLTLGAGVGVAIFFAITSLNAA